MYQLPNENTNNQVSIEIFNSAFQPLCSSTNAMLAKNRISHLYTVEDIKHELFISLSRRQSLSPIKNLTAYLRTATWRLIQKLANEQEQLPIREGMEIENFPNQFTEPDIINGEQQLRAKMNELSLIDQLVLDITYWRNPSCSQEGADMINQSGKYNKHCTAENYRQMKSRAIARLRKIY